MVPIRVLPVQLVRVLLTTVQPRQLRFCWFVRFFHVLRFVCKYASRQENIPEMLIGCQRVFLIVATDV